MKHALFLEKFNFAFFDAVFVFTSRFIAGSHAKRILQPCPSPA